jgi:SAM-dependent methyltransferase
MKCRICNNEENNQLYTIKEMMYGSNELFHYFECNNCKCLQIEKIPESIASYYLNDYYSFSKFNESKYKGGYGKFKLKKYESSLKPKGIVNNIFRFLFHENRYDELRQFNINKESRILDVGTGNGEFLYPLYQLGHKNVLGIDPYLSQDIIYSNGLKIEKKSIFSISTGWDLITYNHVFEHLESPQKEIERISEILNPDGVCVISIPTVSSYAWRKYRTFWYQIDAPRHFYLHSLKSMEILANNVGLGIKSIHYNSIYTQFYYSELNQQGIAMRDRPKMKGLKKISWKYQKHKFNRLAHLLNKKLLGDQLAFVLAKQDR